MLVLQPCNINFIHAKRFFIANFEDQAIYIRSLPQKFEWNDFNSKFSDPTSKDNVLGLDELYLTTLRLKIGPVVKKLFKSYSNFQKFQNLRITKRVKTWFLNIDNFQNHIKTFKTLKFIPISCKYMYFP